MASKNTHYINAGRLEVYLELLKTGIREICMPNYGAFKEKELDYIDGGARKHGFRTILVTYNRTKIDGTKFKSYQRIIYRKNRREDVMLLRRKLQKVSKEKGDHEVIGKLFCYSKEAIAAFVNK